MKVRALVKVRPTYSTKGLVSLNDNISLYSDIFQLQLSNNTGVSILTSYKEKPPVKKLPIFSEFMKNSAKFIKKTQV